MTYGPRLLVRIVLPEGFTPNDVVASAPNPADASFNPGTLSNPPMMLMSDGETWPVEWNVKGGGP